jgi:O-methyltransferase
MRKQLMKQIAAPLRKSGRLEQLLKITRHSGSGESSAIYQVVVPHATLSPWWVDDAFQAVWLQVRDATLVDIYRLYELWSLAGQVRDLAGDIVEVGVWRGGSGCTLASRTLLDGTGATVYLCDTFAGVVKAGEHDAEYEGGELADTSADMVRGLVRKMNLGNVQVLEGVFPDDTSDRVPSDQLRLVHIDVDVYDSARDVFDWAWPRVVPGGVVVFDDYGFYSQEGVTRFVDELAGSGDLTFLHNVNGHAVFVKR